MFHYTDKPGWNAIRSQIVWQFKISVPKDPNRPKGAYFTDLEPSPTNLRVLYKKIRVPREKQEYVFWIKGVDDLTRLNNGTGRDKRIFFSPIDYQVAEEHQLYGNVTQVLSEKFP